MQIDGAGWFPLAIAAALAAGACSRTPQLAAETPIVNMVTAEDEAGVHVVCAAEAATLHLEAIRLVDAASQELCAVTAGVDDTSHHLGLHYLAPRGTKGLTCWAEHRNSSGALVRVSNLIKGLWQPTISGPSAPSLPVWAWARSNDGVHLAIEIQSATAVVARIFVDGEKKVERAMRAAETPGQTATLGLHYLAPTILQTAIAEFEFSSKDGSGEKTDFTTSVTIYEAASAKKPR